MMILEIIIVEKYSDNIKRMQILCNLWQLVQLNQHSPGAFRVNECQLAAVVHQDWCLFDQTNPLLPELIKFCSDIFNLDADMM
jgi:hypothetical protein